MLHVQVGIITLSRFYIFIFFIFVKENKSIQEAGTVKEFFIERSEITRTTKNSGEDMLHADLTASNTTNNFQDPCVHSYETCVVSKPKIHLKNVLQCVREKLHTE